MLKLKSEQSFHFKQREGFHCFQNIIAACKLYELYDTISEDAIIGFEELKELSDKLGDGAVRLSEALDVFDTNNDGKI